MKNLNLFFSRPAFYIYFFLLASIDTLNPFILFLPTIYLALSILRVESCLSLKNQQKTLSTTRKKYLTFSLLAFFVGLALISKTNSDIILSIIMPLALLVTFILEYISLKRDFLDEHKLVVYDILVSLLILFPAGFLSEKSYTEMGGMVGFLFVGFIYPLSIIITVLWAWLRFRNN